MAIYKRKDLSNLKQWRLIIEISKEDFKYDEILKESPNFDITDKNKNIKLYYTIKCDRGPGHGPRIKVLSKNPGVDDEMVMIVNRDESITIKPKLIGNNSMVTAKQYAGIVGGFAKYAVDDIYDAYYNENYNKAKMDKIIDNYEDLSNSEKKRYISFAKSHIKVVKGN